MEVNSETAYQLIEGITEVLKMDNKELNIESKLEVKNAGSEKEAVKRILETAKKGKVVRLVYDAKNGILIREDDSQEHHLKDTKCAIVQTKDEWHMF